MLTRSGIVGGIQASVWRMMGNHTRLPSGFSGAANWSMGNRARHRMPASFRYIQAVIPTFSPTGSSPATADTDFPTAMSFTCALEYPFTAAVTGLPARVPFLFSGSEIASYDPSTGPFGYILSDILDLGSYVPAQAAFGSWTVAEFTSQSSPGSNTLPVGTFIGSSLYAGVNEKQVLQTSSLISSAWAKSASNISPATTTPIAGFTPFFRVLVPTSTKSVLMFGDSIRYGFNEGANGTGTLGDGRGDQYGNSGWSERWIDTVLNKGFVNLSRSGERTGLMLLANHIRRRLAFATLSNATHLDIETATNDLSLPTTAATLKTNTISLNAAIQASLSGTIPYYLPTVLPKSASSVGHWTAADASDQTHTGVNGFGGVGSEADLWNGMVRDLNSGLGHTAFIEACRTVEYSTSGTLFWQGDGVTPRLYTPDGTHSTSDGAAKIAAGLVGDPYS